MGVLSYSIQGVSVMRCFFFKDGHVASVEEMLGFTSEEALARARVLLEERKNRFDGFEVWDGARMLHRFPGSVSQTAA